jgi:DNA polymerase-3 subunit alpha
MHAVVAERTANGPFKDLFDFARRLDVKSFNKRQFESLAKAGAFDRLNTNRAQTLAAAELLLRHASVAAADRESQQVSLFGEAPDATSRAALPQQADWQAMERLQHEFEAIGFYLSSHPLDAYGRSLERVGVLRSAELAARVAMGGPSRFKLAGIVVGKKERTSARGNRFAFLQMSDASGFFEVTVFSEVLAQARTLLDAGQPLLVTVDARAEEDSVRLTAQGIQPLDGVVAQAAAGLKVFVSESDALSPLRNLIGRESGGKGRVTVVVPVAPAREVEIALPGGFRISPKVRAAVKSLPGILEVLDI